MAEVNKSDLEEMNELILLRHRTLDEIDRRYLISPECSSISGFRSFYADKSAKFRSFVSKYGFVKTIRMVGSFLSDTIKNRMRR